MMEEAPEKAVLEAVSLGLKKLRESRGKSQREVLDDTGIHIARIEARITGVGIASLKRLCNYYGITVREFFTSFCEL